MGSEQAREVLEKHGIFATDYGMFAHRASVAIAPAVLDAMLSFATTAREQALREAAEKARSYKAYDDNLQRSAGCPTVGERIATSILSLLTKEPKA